MVAFPDKAVSNEDAINGLRVLLENIVSVILPNDEPFIQKLRHLTFIYDESLDQYSDEDIEKALDR